MLFSLKLQRDSRQNALAVNPAKGKIGEKGCIFHLTVEMKQPQTIQSHWKRIHRGSRCFSYAPVRLCHQQPPNRHITIWHWHLRYLPPVNGLPEQGRKAVYPVYPLPVFLCNTWSSLYFACRVHVIAPAPKSVIALFKLQIPRRSQSIRLLLPFRYLINPNTPILGCISSSIWI